MNKAQIVSTYRHITLATTIACEHRQDKNSLPVTRLTDHNIYIDGVRYAWPSFHRLVRNGTFKINTNEQKRKPTKRPCIFPEEGGW